MSPILRDALINSRWWLSSHRRSLHCLGDHLQRATASVLRFYETEEINPGDSKMEGSWTLTSSASYDSRSFLRLFATSYCHRVVETKSRQNRTFDPGGCRGHFRAYPFLEPWRALVCGEVLRAGAAGDELQRFSEEIRWLFEKRPFMMPRQEKVSPSRAARGYTNWREERRSRRHGDSR